MALPTAASVVASGLAAYPSVYFDRTAVATLQSNLAYYGALDLKTMPDRNGVVMQLFDHSKMASNTTAVTEGTPFAGQAITQNTRQITLSQYADYISISDKVDKTQLIDQGKAAAELLGYRGALSVDNLIGAVLDAARTADATTQISLTTASTYVTAAKVRQAAFALRATDTPPKANGLFYGVIHSLIAFDLVNDSAAGGFQDVWKYTDGSKASLANGISANHDGTPNRVATIGGVELFESNNVKSTANYVSTSTGYDTYIFGKNAIFGASLGKTALGEKNFSVEYKRFDGGNSLDPAALIRAAVVYNFFFGCAVRPGSTNGFRVIRAVGSLT
jgi:N4-gp56 family major capsid protein